MTKRIVIVGGVAGGASCAARARRLMDDASIVVLERGPYVSFANCGLPYHVGGVIPEEKDLLLASPQLFKARFGIDVRVENEAVAIDRAARTVSVRERASGRIYDEPYDALVLSPGAAPIRPPLPGIDLEGIFSVRTVPDARAIRAWIDERKVAAAVVVGGGFIGIEMAENLRHRGIKVVLVEAAEQVMPPFDPEMVGPFTERIREAGVELLLGDAVASFAAGKAGIEVATRNGAKLDADLVIMAIGVKPEVDLARTAGLAIGERGGIRVDAKMRTSDPAIHAVGDAVEVRDLVTGAWMLLPLAGPANRQGRVAADVIAGRDVSFPGVIGTAVCGAFGMTVAATGASEKALLRAGVADFEKIWLFPADHVRYYPGAATIGLKLLFSKKDGRVLGAQAFGEAGVEKRIDVIASVLRLGGTVHDLENLELCYAPQYGSARDPVNMAGMIAANVIKGDMPLGDWATLEADLAGGAVLLDVREARECAAGMIPGSINIPLSVLRERSGELPRDRAIMVTCQVGQRGHYATRLLLERGHNAMNLSGGYRTWSLLKQRKIL
jgi:NADPH-dependent 2,4-dienoyl-CoA reductase/sulfur reductase-like enzyme/rhodanese-related sulfurtransferase